MSFDFLEWYGWAYCLEDFETIELYEEHKKVAYSGWVAATDRLRGGPGSDRSIDS